jgi:hypothetical protein
MMNWPAIRVEKFFDAYYKRKIIEELNQRKLGMISALWANSNYDGEKNAEIRQRIIDQLEEQFSTTCLKIYNPGYKSKDEIEEEKLKSNPFFAAGRKKLVEQGLIEEE